MAYNWDARIDLTDVWTDSGEDADVLAAMPKIIEVLEREYGDDYYEDGMLGNVIMNLKYYARLGDIDGWNRAWDELYDWADYMGVWIITRGVNE